MKIAELVRFMGPDERERVIVTITMLHQPSFVLNVLIWAMRAMADRDKDEQMLGWIGQLERIKQEMMGRDR